MRKRQGRSQRARKALVLALPLSLGWTVYTAQPTIGNFLLGYAFSVVAVLASGLQGESLRWRNPLRQLTALVQYVLRLALEALLSGIRVAVVILKPNMPVQDGLQDVSTFDESESELVSAICAHGITLTPGEQVIDFEETEDRGVIMVVHSLDMERSRPTLEEDQQARLKRVRRILGHDRK